jgi:hypothetical protein
MWAKLGIALKSKPLLPRCNLENKRKKEDRDVND